MKTAQEQQVPQSGSLAQWRIKESQIFVTIQRFRDTMTHYNRETLQHRDHCKNIIMRELEIGS